MGTTAADPSNYAVHHSEVREARIVHLTPSRADAAALFVQPGALCIACLRQGMCTTAEGHPTSKGWQWSTIAEQIAVEWLSSCNVFTSLTVFAVLLQSTASFSSSKSDWAPEEHVSSLGIKLQPGTPLYQINVEDLHPTQLCVGLQQVRYRELGCVLPMCTQGQWAVELYVLTAHLQPHLCQQQHL